MITQLPDGKYRVWGMKPSSTGNHYLLDDEDKNTIHFHDVAKAFRLIFLPTLAVFEKSTVRGKISIVIIRKEY